MNEKSVAQTAKEEKDAAYVRRIVVDWQDIETAATCLPAYEEKAKALIRTFLGYLPPFPLIYVRQEPFLRSLIAGFHQGGMSEPDLVQEAEVYAKLIRNDDMKKHGFADQRIFTPDDYRYYDTQLTAFRQPARKRITDLLGYEPKLAYSLGAEIYLRQLFQMENYYDGMSPCAMDYRALTILNYRQQLVLGGTEAADATPLLGLRMLEQAGIAPCAFLLESI